MKLIPLGTSHGATEKGRFCTALYLEAGGRNYLIDCGAPVEGLLTNRDIDISGITGVFITHMHEDHIGCITQLIKRFSVYQKEHKVSVYLPEESGIAVLKEWCRAIHMPFRDRVFLYPVHEGLFYEDGCIRVTAIPTDHIHGFPTFAYLIEAEGKKVLFTGDLSSDLHDFPAAACETELDGIVSELTHYNVTVSGPIIADSRTKRVLFVHVTPANVARLSKEMFPFPVEIARDGETYEF